MKIRYYLALWMAKLSIIALKVTGHNGTDFPGTVALKICPDFLAHADMPSEIIGITGTNGKTTVTNLIIDVLKVDGRAVLNNNLGSNTITGIITSLIRNSSVGGKCRYDTAVLEIDERSSRLVFRHLKPTLLLINNLTRDSIMRNGHPEFISRILTENMPSETRLVLNADDLIAANVAPGNPRVYFGIDRMDSDVTECKNLINDMQICPKCATVLKYEYLRYHHIGRAYCPSCGFRSPECDYLASGVDIEKMTVDITKDGFLHTYRLLNSSVFNIYNVVALVSVLMEMGYEADRIAELLQEVQIVSSRFDVIEKGKFRIIKQMSKDRNALGSSRAFDYISGLPGRKELILMMNNLYDNKHWSENICWLYDCDFEFLNREDINNIVCTGPRAKDYYLRLKMAGIADDKITLADTETEAPHKLLLAEPEDIYVLFGTDSIVLCNQVVQKVAEEIEERGIN